MNLDERSIKSRIRFHKDRIEQLEKTLEEMNKKVVLLRGTIVENGGIFVKEKAEELDLSRIRVRLEMEVVKEGRVITCTLTSASENIKGIGIARCCEDDTFNLSKGMRLAEMRARQNLYAKIAKRFEENM